MAPSRLSPVLTEAFPWETAPRYLLRDRDAAYGAEFCKRADAMGITEVFTAPRSPWQNAQVERVLWFDSLRVSGSRRDLQRAPSAPRTHLSTALMFRLRSDLHGDQFDDQFLAAA
jgi:hypothetical protein